MNFPRSITLFLLLIAADCASAQRKQSFNYDIRPILSEYCYACHGPDENHREADLRLDVRDSAIEYGAIVPGEASDSLLVERILTDDPDIIMPPVKGGKKLSREQKQQLVDWIGEGAIYQKHWAFEPVPESIEIPETESSWAINDIDRFIARVQQSKGLKPSREVDRATWLRRVTFDLNGLPPTIEDLDLFLADDSADAYEKVVDRLLASSAYGERMANMWLDVARYADTFGYQNDIPMEVWPWREWVINAFNRNLPYDQFIIEQIAGDLLPEATQDQRLATTFNRLHRQTNEGGSIPEEFRLTGVADRTTTAGTAFLGLTLECSRCHDHKFDPIKQRDFYRLSAYFSDIDEFGLYSHFTFAQPTPAMPLYQDGQRESHQAAIQVVKDLEQAYKQALENSHSSWLENKVQLIDELPIIREPVTTMPLDGDVDGIVGKATKCNGDKEIVCKDAPEFGRTSPFSFSLWVHPAISQPRMLVLHQAVAAEDSGFRGLQLTLNDGRPQFSMIHFWPGNAVRIEAKNEIPTKQWTHLAVTHDGSGRASGLWLFIDGQQVDVEVIRDKLTRDIRHRKEWGDMKVGNVNLALGARFRDVGFRDGLVDDLKIFDVQLSRAEVASIFYAIKPTGSITIDPALAIDHQVLAVDSTLNQLREELRKAREHENEVITGIRNIMVMQHDPDAPPTHVLQRGEYTAKGEQVAAGLPDFLGRIPIASKSAAEEPDRKDDRLTLARWMTSSSNPLTARVMVNRMWHLFFGRGIVVSLEDFGSQGTPPTHPQLLDYLARSLMDENWNLKSLCRKIVLSATYRQSSAIENRESYHRDPANAFLSRGPKHRLSAEQLRDAVLFASGLLVQKVGGPSVMPYQPAGLWKEAGTGKTYRQSKGDGLYRRSLYTFWKRTAPPPSMLTFDATSRETCTARRELTTTPLQALVFLNDPQYIEASRVLAERLIEKHGESKNARWHDLFRCLISRAPTEQESKIVNQLYDEQRSYFLDDEGRALQLLSVGDTPANSQMSKVDVAATTMVVQTIISYDETIMLR